MVNLFVGFGVECDVSVSESISVKLTNLYVNSQHCQQNSGFTGKIRLWG